MPLTPPDSLRPLLAMCCNEGCAYFFAEEGEQVAQNILAGNPGRPRRSPWPSTRGAHVVGGARERAVRPVFPGRVVPYVAIDTRFGS